MALPDYQSIMMPLMQYASDGQIHSFAETCEHLARHFELDEDALRELLPSGRYPVFRSRVGWATTYLTKAGVLERPSRGRFRITVRGREALRHRETIDNTFLRQYPEFVAFHDGTDTGTAQGSPTPQIFFPETPPPVRDERTPDELLEYAYLELRKALVQELLEQITHCSSRFFEALVVDVLVAMGYGGSRKDAAQVVGKSGDEGIDGIIKEDHLGLDNIYIQAKKWSDKKPVCRPEIQKFVGALQGHHASKGVFITTGRFSESAKSYVKNLNCKVVLIDGEQLGQYMIDFNVGVSARNRYEIKKLDTDYFSED
jgi:restriction system protein